MIQTPLNAQSSPLENNMASQFRPEVADSEKELENLVHNNN